MWLCPKFATIANFICMGSSATETKTFVYAQTICESWKLLTLPSHLAANPYGHHLVWQNLKIYVFSTICSRLRYVFITVSINGGNLSQNCSKYETFIFDSPKRTEDHWDWPVTLRNGENILREMFQDVFQPFLSY